MYVGRKHTVVGSTTVEGDWSCAACGWSGSAVAEGVGEGVGNSPFLLDEDGARKRAKAQAGEAATRDAEVALSIAPCPRCDVRDPSAVKAYRRKAALVTAGLLAFGLGIGVVIGALTQWVWGLGTGLVAAGAGIWVENQKRSGTWDRSATGVTFTEKA